MVKNQTMNARFQLIIWLLPLFLLTLSACGSDMSDDDDTAPSNDDDAGDDDDTSSDDDDSDDDDGDLTEYPCWFEATLTSKGGSHTWSGACGTGTATGIHFMLQPGSEEPHRVSRISAAPSEYLDPYCSFRVTVNTCGQESGVFGTAVDELSADYVRVKVETEGCGLAIGRARTSSSTASVTAEVTGLTPTEIDRSISSGSIVSSGHLSFDATKTSSTNEEWTISGVVSWSETATTVGELGIDCL